MSEFPQDFILGALARVTESAVDCVTALAQVPTCIADRLLTDIVENHEKTARAVTNYANHKQPTDTCLGWPPPESSVQTSNADSGATAATGRRKTLMKDHARSLSVDANPSASGDGSSIASAEPDTDAGRPWGKRPRQTGSTESVDGTKCDRPLTPLELGRSKARADCVDGDGAAVTTATLDPVPLESHKCDRNVLYTHNDTYRG